MKYRLFYTGNASTPNTIGLLCVTTNQIVNEVEIARPSGKETRIRYEKMKRLLLSKYYPLFHI